MAGRKTPAKTPAKMPAGMPSKDMPMKSSGMPMMGGVPAWLAKSPAKKKK